MAECHDCRCPWAPPCSACVTCKHWDVSDCPNDCQTCEYDHERTGPYRLADGTWSDGVDRTSKIKLHKFHIDNPSRSIVIQTWDQLPDGGYEWVAIESKYGEPEYFPTHAEAIAYADRMARTNQEPADS